MQRFSHGGDVYAKANKIRLDFSVNLNPLGMPEEIKRAICERVDSYSAYPDPYCRELTAALAIHHSCNAEHILPGNGSADLIFRLCLALKPRRVLVCAPTFSEYEKAALAAGAVVSYHTLSADDGFNVTASILDAVTPDTELVFVCNPNNPTGLLADRELLLLLAKRCASVDAHLMVDECFLDFTHATSLIPELESYPNLVVLKAFTKLYAMAGLRLGYVLCADTALLAAMRASSQSWSVSTVAQVAGLAALTVPAWRERTLSFLDSERERVFLCLCNNSFYVFPGKANYLLIKNFNFPYDRLLAEGILVRPCNNFINLGPEYFRIGIKTAPENDELLAALTSARYNA